MPVSTDTDLLIKAFKIEDKGSPIGVWLYYDTDKEILRTTRVNANIAYLGDFLRPPMTPSEIFVRQTYTSLSFSTDFNLGGSTSVISRESGPLTSTTAKNNIFVYYKPPKLSDVFTFTLYSSDDSTNKIVVLPITISLADVYPIGIQGNPTINTRNNKYTDLTMIFSEGGAEAGVVTSSFGEVTNVSFSDGKCKFDYTTPATNDSDTIIFTNIIAADIHEVNKTVSYSFQITGLLEQPNFSSWIYTPASKNFLYTNTDSLIAVFNKDIETCTSITATSGTPTTIIPISIIGKQVKFDWESLETGSVTFTFNGLTSVDGSIDATVDGLTTVGPINLYTPPTIVGWNGTQPTEENTSYTLSVTFNKELTNTRIPVITATEGVSPVFTSVSGSQVNFTLTTSSTPSTTIYSIKNVSALDGSIAALSNISAGAKINSVQVETDLAGSFATTSKLVIGRTQKVKIILSKPITVALSFVPNDNCTFGDVQMINTSTAVFTILPSVNTSLTIQTNNIITLDGSQSILSHTFNLISGQTIVNLFESSNRNVVKTTFDVGTTVALSLEMSKEISSDLTNTTITSSNGTIDNVSISDLFGKYYYNFDFTPTAQTTNQTIYVNQAKDLNDFVYNLSQSGLTFINPYTFATSFNFLATDKNRYYGQGYLSQGISSSLILTFTGGDNLHSNDVQKQISYVSYIQGQGGQENIITDLSCSTSQNTVTINSITPLSSNSLIIKVVLKSPNGALSNEITGTILPADFSIPITAVGVTSTIPSPYKLVSNSSVDLRFNFNTSSAFSSQVLSSFSATVNGNNLPLTLATVSSVSLIVPYAASSAIYHTFVFSAFSQHFTFVIESSQVYTYPTIINTTKNIPVISLDQTLTVTSNFLSVLPSSMTASVTVTPNGYSSPSPYVQTYVGTISDGTLLDVTTPTWYYPFTDNIQNYASGVGVTDATIGVAGNTTGGNATFNDGLVLTGSANHNAQGASYIVLPPTSSGNTAAFSCWFKSNNNGSSTRIIDMASNGTFRLYVNGSNSLNFNDVYSFSTATNINNNTWNFIAINTTATTLSWVLNSGDAGNYGSGSISSKPVDFDASVGYLGHSFGGDPEFAGSLKQVCFYANTNLTSQQISALYMGTTRVSISHKVERDVNHLGLVNLHYGNTSNPYNWGSNTLTSSNIYTFPSSFTYNGLANGYNGGAHLKAGNTGALTLTFTGGDFLHSNFVSTQVEYVKFAQNDVDTPITEVTCSDEHETVTIASITPASTADLTLKVKLRGPDGTPSSEIRVIIPSTQIVPQWVPTAAGSVSSNVSALHKLVVGSEVQLTFGFVAGADFPSTTASMLFSLHVDNVLTALTGAVVNTTARTVSVAYKAESVVDVTFVFSTSYGTSYSFTVSGTEVYTFPTMDSTTRGVSVVTLGENLVLTTVFSASLPPSTTAAVSIVPANYLAVTPLASVSDSSVVYSIRVEHDVVHTGTVTLIYGAVQRPYLWTAGTLTAAHIYTFPSSFTYNGLANGYGSAHLKVGTAGALTLTFTGGNLLHSSVVSTQVEYVKFAQNDVDTPITAVTCSEDLKTVTIASITPASTADLTLKVKLRGPDGTPSSEIRAIIPSAQIVPPWAPTAAGSVSSNMPAPHKLVVGSEVQLTFGFVAGADFPSTTASMLFSLRVNGVSTALTGAVVNATARTVRVAYNAATADAVAFEFSTTYGTSYSFTVSAAEVYTFPTMDSTTRGVSVVTLGENLVLTSVFSALLPGTTAAVSIVPAGYLAVTPTASVSGSSVVYSIRVEHDVVHTGTVTLIYGAVQKEYSWVAGTLTAAHIYTFPSSFTIVGTNAYGTGLHLKETNQGTLLLTFVGGDLLHSASAAAQVSYVTYTQGTTTNPVTIDLLTLPNTASILLTPVDTTALTLSVQLKGPDGTPGGVMTAIVPSAQIAPAGPPAWAPTAAAGVTVTVGSANLVAGTTVQLRFAFTAPQTFPANAAESFSARANGVVLSLGSATVSGKALLMSFTPPGPAMGYTFIFYAFGRSFIFTLLAPAYWYINGNGTTTISGSTITMRTAANAISYMRVLAYVSEYSAKSIKISWTGYNYDPTRYSGCVLDEININLNEVLGSMSSPSGTREVMVQQDLAFYNQSDTATSIITQTAFSLEFDMTDVQWLDGDGDNRIIGNMLFTGNFLDAPFATGAWVSNYAYAVRISNDWLLVQFTSNTVRTAWRRGDPGYVPTVGSILAATQTNTTYPWTGTLQYRFA